MRCSHLKAWLGKDPFHSSLTWLLAGITFLQLLARGCPLSLAMWTFLEGSSHIEACFIKASKRIQRESQIMMEASCFYNLIPQATPHHFCHMLFIRCELPGPVKTKRGYYIQGPESEAQGRDQWDYLERCMQYRIW